MRSSEAGAARAAKRGVAFALPLLIVAGNAAAGTIEVQGTGAAEAAVVAYRLEFRLTAAKETAIEAARQFIAVRARVDKAFAELALSGLVVTGSGVEIEYSDKTAELFGGVQIVNGRRVEPQIEREAKFSERITVRIPAAPGAAAAPLLEQIAQVLDVADEVGLDPVGIVAIPAGWVQPPVPGVTPPRVFSVEVADAEAVRLSAERAALAEARGRAERLAGAAGLQLGDVLTIRVVRSGPLAPAGGSLHLARQEVELSVQFATR